MTKRRSAILYLQDDCPYSCAYCALNSPGYQRHTNSLAATEEGRTKIIRFFEERPGYHTFLTGGEVMLMPGFAELCIGLAQNAHISIDTANSVGGELFDQVVTALPPEKVGFIRCALHPHDETPSNLEAYLGRIKTMQDRGFPVFVSFVAAPERLDRIPHYYSLFRASGIPFVVAPLITREYPSAYTSSQVDLIDRYSVSAVYRSRMGEFRRSCGQLCSAGVTRTNINCITGQISPCWRCRAPIGNVYDNSLSLQEQPRACDADWCSVEYEPQLNLEEPFGRDLQNVLDMHEHYDRRLYATILERSGLGTGI